MTDHNKTARVIQVNVNPDGGVPKHRVSSAAITTNGVSGDKQRDLEHHGGPRRAVSLYSYELIQELQAEGHPIEPGTTGENLTISGFDWPTLQVGDRLRVGEQVLIEITGYAVPCSNLVDSFVDGRFKRISQKLHPGWSRLYASVLSEGTIHEGDRVERTAGS